MIDRKTRPDYRLWHDRYGSRTDVLTHTSRLNGATAICPIHRPLATIFIARRMAGWNAGTFSSPATACRSAGRITADFLIGELGFGTGLNFGGNMAAVEALSRVIGQQSALHVVRALSDAPRGNRPCAFPLAGDRCRAAGPGRSMAGNASGNGILRLDDQTALSVVCGRALDGVAATEAGFDAWYLDGFAPSRNADMWSAELMRLVCEKTHAGRNLCDLCGGRVRAAQSDRGRLCWSSGAAALPESAKCSAASKPSSPSGPACCSLRPNQSSSFSSSSSGLIGFDM